MLIGKATVGAVKTVELTPNVAEAEVGHKLKLSALVKDGSGNSTN